MSDISGQIATVIARTNDLAKLAGYGYALAAAVVNAAENWQITNQSPAEKDHIGLLLKMSEHLMAEADRLEWMKLPERELN